MGFLDVVPLKAAIARSHFFDNFESTNNYCGLSIRTIIIMPVMILFGSPASAAIQTSDLAIAEKFLERGQILYEKSAYDSLPYYYLRAKVIFQHHSRPIQAAECFLGMADYFRLNNQLDRSALTLDSACTYIEEHLGQDSESWADALNTRAKLLIDLSQYEQAIVLLEQSLGVLEGLNAEREKMARTEYLLGTSYYYHGNMQKSLEYNLKAYESYEQIMEGPSVVKGWLLYSLGLLYNHFGNQQKWKETIYESIRNDTALFGQDHPELAQYYSSLVSYFIDNGMSDSALYYLEKAEVIAGKAINENHRVIVSLYVQHARIFRLQGDYDRALEYFQQALGILKKNSGTGSFEERKLYLNMGNFYKSWGDYRSAEKVLHRLLEFEGRVHPTIMAAYYSYLADIQRLLGNYTQSEKYFRMVFEINDQYLSPDYHTRVNDFIGYGILLDSLRKYSKAEHFYLKALSIAENNYGFHHLKTSRSLKSMGDHYSLNGEHDKALACYQRCIFSLVPDYDTTGYVFNPLPDQVTDDLFYLGLLKSKASVLKDLAWLAADSVERKQNMMAVYSSYQTSINIIDQLRNSYLSDRSKLYLSENERGTYEKCVESAYQCYELSSEPEYLEQAFMVAEKGKYATLTSVLQREKTIALAGIPDSILQMDASLRKELSFQQELLLESQEDTLYDTMAVERYQARIFQIRARIESLNNRLETEFPAYYNLLYNQQVLGPDALRKNLRSSEKMLEYFYAGRYLYRFELSSQGMDCQRMLLEETFDQELDIVEKYLSRNFQRDTLEISYDLFLTAAHNLYKRLIPPSPDHSRLIIIPEGRLSYFPFDILVSEPVKHFSGLFNQVPFLIKDHTLRYGYSATLLNRLKKGERIRLDKLIAFAPGYGHTPAPEAHAGESRENTIDRTSLRSLPGSIKEVVEIGKLSGGRVFTGRTASEELFKKLAGEGHILHLATHAFLDDEDPLKSKLVFSEGNAEEDGFLNVYEIYNLNLVARMVVLSACSTGSGEMKRGEGIMSLARAFIYAGVPNIVMTLWTVSDRQSYELMLGFYRQLMAGRSTETALRRAKLEFLEQASPSYQHPQYWAGYILVGNPDRFFLSRLYKWMIPVLLVILIMVPGFMAMRRRMVRRQG